MIHGGYWPNRFEMAETLFESSLINSLNSRGLKPTYDNTVLATNIVHRIANLIMKEALAYADSRGIEARTIHMLDAHGVDGLCSMYVHEEIEAGTNTINSVPKPIEDWIEQQRGVDLLFLAVCNPTGKQLFSDHMPVLQPSDEFTGYEQLVDATQNQNSTSFFLNQPREKK